MREDEDNAIIDDAEAFLSNINEISQDYKDDGPSVAQLASLSAQKLQVQQQAQDRLESYRAKRAARLKAGAEAKAARRAEFEEELENNKGIQIGKLLDQTAEQMEQEDNERERQLRLLAKEEEQLQQRNKDRRGNVDNYLENRFERTQRHYDEEIQKLEAEKATREAERQRKIDAEKAKKAEKKRKKEEMEKRRQARLAAKQADEAAKP